MNEELIALYYNIDRYYPGALQGDVNSFAEFFGSNQAALRGFLDTAETQYPKAFQNYTEPSSAGRERAQDTGVDPMNWMAANPEGGEFVRPNRTGPKSKAEIMNSVFPLPTREIKAAQAQKAQEKIQTLAPVTTSTGRPIPYMPYDNTSEDKSTATLRKLEKDALPEVLQGQDLANVYPEQLLPLYDRRQAASEQDKAGLAQAGEDAVFGKKPVMLTARKQPVVTRGGEWYEPKQPEVTGDDAESNLRFILATTPLQKEDIMKATGIEGLAYEELLRVKDFIAADDKIRANEHLRALDLYTKAINSKIENTPDEIRAAYDVIGSISGKTELSDEEMQAARNAAQIIQDNPEAAKAYEDAISSAQNAQKGYSNVQQKYPDVKLADDMNRMIQEGAKSDKISQAWQVGRTLLFGPLAPIAEVAGRPLVEAAKAYEDKISQAWQVGKTLLFGPLAPIADVVGRPLVEAVPRLWGSVSSTLDAELAMGGDQGAASREIRRSLARRPYGTFRDSDSALRPIREKTATFNYDGKEYEMGFDNGVPTEIYDKETGNIAPLGLDVKESLMQEAMATKLEASGSYKLNTDPIVNTIQDVSSDLLGTFALAAATQGVGSGAVLSRVREMGAVMLQFQGRYVEDGLRKGMNMDQAVRYGRLMASIEGASEMVFPNISKVVDGPVAANVTDAVRRIVAGSDTKLVNAFARKEVLRALAGIPQEGAEELLVDWATPVANELVNNLSNTELDTEMPSIAKQIETFAIGAAVSVIPNLIGGVRARNWARDNRSLEESVLQAVRNLDDVKALAETGAIPQLETLLPVLENVARRASVDLEDKSLTGKQLSKRVAALFDDELAKKDRTDTTGTPDESKAEKAAKDAEKAVEESYKAEGDPAPKTFVDFDNTLWDNANQRLTPLGEEMKRRIANGDDITVLTAREDADGSDTAFIAEKLGISPDNVKTNLSPEEKAAELTDGSTYIDDKAENRDAAAARNVPGIQIVNPADLPGNPSVITENDSQNTQRISGEVQGGQESGGPIQDQGPGGEAAQTGGNVQAPQEVVAPRIQYTPVTDSEFSAFEDTEQVTPERKQMIAQRIASGEILSDTEEVMRQAVADEVQTLVDGMQNEAIAGVTQELSNAPIQATSLKTLAPILQKVFGLTKRGQASNTAKLMDRMVERMAERAGISKKKMYGRISFQQVTEEEMKAIREGNGEQLLEDQKDVKHRAAVQLLSDGRAIIYAISSPNVSSPLHELAHIYRQFLQSEERDAILKQYYGKSELGENDVWNRDVEEFFARGFERYLYEGAVSNKTMRDIYDKFKKWLADIYNDFLGSEIDVPINDQMRAIYAAMLGEGVIGFSNRELSQDERVVNNALNNIFGTPLFQSIGRRGALALRKAGDEEAHKTAAGAKKAIERALGKWGFRGSVPADTSGENFVQLFYNGNPDFVEDMRRIKKRTGWELDREGNMVYEVGPLTTVEITEDLKRRLLNGFVPLNEIIAPDNPLQKAYPEFLRDCFVSSNNEMDALGGFLDLPDGESQIMIHSQLLDMPEPSRGFVEVPGPTPGSSYVLDAESFGRTLEHEVQHLIQAIEGFDPGANPREMSYNIAAAEFGAMDYDQFVSEIAALTSREERRQLMDQFNSVLQTQAVARDAFELYARTYGEVSARTNARRFGMSQEERRNTLLYDTEDYRDQELFASASAADTVLRLSAPQNRRAQTSNIADVVEAYDNADILEPELLAEADKIENAPDNVSTLRDSLREALSSGNNREAVTIGQDLADALRELAPLGVSQEITIFTPEQTAELDNLITEIANGYQETIGQSPADQNPALAANGAESYGFGRVYDEAAMVVAAVHRASEQARQEGRINTAQDVAQIKRAEAQYLEKYAKAVGSWTEDLDAENKERFLTKGMESRVYKSPDDTSVIKGNDGVSYSSWNDFLEGVGIGNQLFPADALTLTGFGTITDSYGNKRFGAILSQPFVQGIKYLNMGQVIRIMQGLGFKPTGVPGEFINEEYGIRISDLHGRNVVKDANGAIRFIDTQNTFVEEASETEALESGEEDTELLFETQRLNDNTHLNETPADYAKRIRDKKIKGAFSAVDFGLSVAIYNGALEFMASQVERGTKVGNALRRTIAWMDQQMSGEPWNKKLFIDYISEQFSRGAVNQMTNEVPVPEKTEVTGTRYKGIKNIDSWAAKAAEKTKIQLPQGASSADLDVALREYRDRLVLRMWTTSDSYVQDVSDSFFDTKIEQARADRNAQLEQTWEYNKANKEEFLELQRSVQRKDFEFAFEYFSLNDVFGQEQIYNIGFQVYALDSLSTYYPKNVSGFSINPLVLSKIYNEHQDSNLNFIRLHTEVAKSIKETGVPLGEYEHKIYKRRAEGSWLKFSQTSSLREATLLNQLAVTTIGRGDWCTGGSVGTAQSQLSDGDFYIFMDNKGQAKIGIRYVGDSTIAEAPRGTESGQNISPEDFKILEEELPLLPGGAAYADQTEQNRLINKALSEEQLTIDEFIKLSEGESFGYAEDPYLKEAKNKILTKEYVAKVFSILPDEVLLVGSKAGSLVGFLEEEYINNLKVVVGTKKDSALRIDTFRSSYPFTHVINATLIFNDGTNDNVSKISFPHLVFSEVNLRGEVVVDFPALEDGRIFTQETFTGQASFPKMKTGEFILFNLKSDKELWLPEFTSGLIDARGGTILTAPKFRSGQVKISQQAQLTLPEFRTGTLELNGKLIQVSVPKFEQGSIKIYYPRTSGLYTFPAFNAGEIRILGEGSSRPFLSLPEYENGQIKSEGLDVRTYAPKHPTYGRGPSSLPQDPAKDPDTLDEKQSIREEAKLKGDFMKAPNGEPTNLNEDQWVTVRTKAFKDWFGDWENNPRDASKVVDENGEPLVVYHGTNNKFTTFNRGEDTTGAYGGAIYFSKSIEEASTFGKNIVHAFLNIRKPVNPFILSNNYSNSLRQAAKDGYDGVTSPTSFVAVLDPNNIKSATDNSGEYSSATNDILFQQPGNRLPSKEEVLGNIRQASQAGNLKGVPFAATYAKGKPYFDKLGITEEEVRDAWGEIPPVDRGDGIPPAAPGPQATVTGTERGGNTQGVPEAVPGEEPIRTPTEATPKQLIERKVAQAFRDWTVEYQDEEASVALSYHTMVNQGLIEDTEEARAEYMQKRMNIPATQTSMNALFLNSYQAFLDAGYSRADFESFIIQTLQQGGLPPTTKTVMLISAIRSFHTPGNKPFLQRSYAELGKLAAQSLNLRRLVSEDPFLSTEEVNTINGTLLRGTGTDTKAMDDAMAALDEASQEGEFADEDLVTEFDPEALDAEIEELTAQLDAPDAESTISKEASEAAAAESKIITTAMEVRMEARDENGDLTTKPFKEQIIDQVNEARKLC